MDVEDSVRDERGHECDVEAILRALKKVADDVVVGNNCLTLIAV